MVGGQWSVWRAADGSPRVVLSVARAFQPEIFPFAFVDRGVGSCDLQAVGLTRSREAAKRDAAFGVRCLVFGLASRGRESAGVRFGALQPAAASMPHTGALWCTARLCAVK